jgi:thymidylate synthase (FAD)
MAKDDFDNSIKVLDHGFVRIIEAWGSDERIVEAAGKPFSAWGPIDVQEPCPQCQGLGVVADPQYGQTSCPKCKATKIQTVKGLGDEKVLRDLRARGDNRPFETAGACFEVQAPLAVFDEWRAVRSHSYSEALAPYSDLPEFDYVPSVDRLMAKTPVKPTADLTVIHADQFMKAMQSKYRELEALRQQGIAWGIPEELTRLAVAQGRYVRARIAANICDWMAFLGEKAAQTARWEIRQYAYAVQRVLSVKFPQTMTVFEAKLA